MKETYRQKPPSVAMRLNDADKAALRVLANRLQRSQTDVVRLLVREADHILPELKSLAEAYPRPIY